MCHITLGWDVIKYNMHHLLVHVYFRVSKYMKKSCSFQKQQTYLVIFTLF